MEETVAEIGALRSATDAQVVAEVVRRTREGNTVEGVLVEDNGRIVIVGGGDMLSLTQAADQLGMSERALRERIHRARSRGEWHPFKLMGQLGRQVLLVQPELLDRWARSWTGRRRIRR